MSGLMFPKAPARKARRAHAKRSILQPDGDRQRCFLCMRLNGVHQEYAKGALHKHHIFEGTALRRISEAEGFFVWLCPYHHEFGRASAHTDIRIRRYLQREAQQRYEEAHTREEFMRLVGRSYL